MPAYRLFVPSESFPVVYRWGRSAHLDVSGRRGQAIRQALADQLGLIVLDVQPFGLSGSAGSTPLRIELVDGANQLPVRACCGGLDLERHHRPGDAATVTRVAYGGCGQVGSCWGGAATP